MIFHSYVSLPEGTSLDTWNEYHIYLVGSLFTYVFILFHLYIYIYMCVCTYILYLYMNNDDKKY